MRISDWSSDVCSSDLGDQAVMRPERICQGVQRTGADVAEDLAGGADDETGKAGAALVAWMLGTGHGPLGVATRLQRSADCNALRMSVAASSPGAAASRAMREASAGL